MSANAERDPVSRTNRTGERPLDSTDPLGSRVAPSELLRRALVHVPGMVYRRRDDERWTLDFASQGCRAVTGFEATDLIGPGSTSYLDLIHPDDRGNALSAVRDALAERGAFQVSYRIRRVDAGERRVLDQGYATLTDDGLPAVEGIVTDISGHGRQTGVRSDPEARFEALVEQSLAGIYVIRDNRFAYVNARFAEIFGYSVEEVVRLPSILELVHPEDRTTVAANIQKRVEGRAIDERYEFRGLTRDGKAVDVEVHGRRVDLEGKPSVLGVILDVSQRKRVERAAREAEKLEAMRRLAAGVAHDLNNFLSTIRTTAELLQLEHGGDDPLGEDLRTIVKAVDDGTTLSRQLTRFAKRRKPAGATDDPTAILSDLAASLRPLLGKRIELRAELSPDLPSVLMDPEELQEIVTYLALDAQDAMPEGGVLTLSARPGPVEPPLSDPGGGASLVLEMTDSGARRPPTGLRSALVSRIVADAGGTLVTSPAEAAETTVRVVLPGSRPDGSRSEP